MYGNEMTMKMIKRDNNVMKESINENRRVAKTIEITHGVLAMTSNG